MSRTLSCIILCLALPVLVGAQDTLTRKEIKKQERDFLLSGNPWTIEIPIWIPGFAGEFAYGGIKIEGEDGVEIENPIEPEPPGEGIGGILKRLFSQNWYLKFFYLTRVSYEQNRVKGQFDMIAGAVGNSVVFNYNNKELVSASFLSVNLRAYGAYKFLQLEGSDQKFRYEAFAYGGIRTYFQKLTSELNETSLALDINPVLVEPIVGLENQLTWKRWLVLLQGDYGSILSVQKRSVQLSAFVHYRIGKLNSIKVGWNHLYVNQKDEFRGAEYTGKLTLSGPTVALAFHF